VGTQAISSFLFFHAFFIILENTGCEWHQGVVNVVVLKQKEKEQKRHKSNSDG
jgi:hypothetical protein